MLHVGAIQKRKNVHRLIEAFSRLPEPWTLVLAGSAGYGAEEILAKATERVKVTGYLTNEQLSDLYRRASIFAFPSLDEGFGMPVIEAMAYGVPVLSSNSSALPEVCGDAAILVDPTNTDQIAESWDDLQPKKACAKTTSPGISPGETFQLGCGEWKNLVNIP